MPVAKISMQVEGRLPDLITQSLHALVVSHRSALFVFLCLLWPFPAKIPLPNFANASIMKKHAIPSAGRAFPHRISLRLSARDHLGARASRPHKIWRDGREPRKVWLGALCKGVAVDARLFPAIGCGRDARAPGWMSSDPRTRAKPGVEPVGGKGASKIARQVIETRAGARLTS